MTVVAVSEDQTRFVKDDSASHRILVPLPAKRDDRRGHFLCQALDLPFELLEQIVTG